jgi:hypothetical protein
VVKGKGAHLYRSEGRKQQEIPVASRQQVLSILLPPTPMACMSSSSRPLEPKLAGKDKE